MNLLILEDCVDFRRTPGYKRGTLVLPIIKEIKQKLRTARGFTMVELMVVLLILGILAALGGHRLIAYVRLARFDITNPAPAPCSRPPRSP